jgi:hypothetical protein
VRCEREQWKSSLLSPIKLCRDPSKSKGNVTAQSGEIVVKVPLPLCLRLRQNLQGSVAVHKSLEASQPHPSAASSPAQVTHGHKGGVWMLFHLVKPRDRTLGWTGRDWSMFNCYGISLVPNVQKHFFSIVLMKI